MIPKRAARLALGLLLIAILLYKLDPFEVAGTISSAKPVYLIFALSLYVTTFLILSTRWRLIVESMGGRLSAAAAYQAFAGGMILSDLTPARIGELSRPLLVRDEIDLETSIASVIIDRYVDVLTILFLGITGLLLFSIYSSYLPILSAMLLAIVITAAYMWQNRSELLDKFVSSSSPGLAPIVHSLSSISAIKNIQIVIIRSMLLTLIAWITHALRIYMIASSVGQDPPLHALFLLLPLVSALSLIPISIAGLGLVEGGMAALLASQGIPPATGLSIAFMDRILTVSFHILIGWRAVSRLV